MLRLRVPNGVISAEQLRVVGGIVARYMIQELGVPLLKRVVFPEADLAGANRKLDKREARIDWRDPARAIERRVRAFDPWPVAWCMIGEERTRIWSATALDREHDGRPGTVLASGPEGIDVAAGEGVLRIRELQRPGKRRTGAADYLNAGPVAAFLESPEQDAGS